MITPVNLYAWGAAGMRKATESKRAPDEAYVKLSDYKVVERAWREEVEKLTMANRIMARRERVAETQKPAEAGEGK